MTLEIKLRCHPIQPSTSNSIYFRLLKQVNESTAAKKKYNSTTLTAYSIFSGFIFQMNITYLSSYCGNWIYSFADMTYIARFEQQFKPKPTLKFTLQPVTLKRENWTLVC